MAAGTSEEEAGRGEEGALGSSGTSSGDGGGVKVVDPTSRRVELMRELYRLSAREAEVVELVARGNTVVRIAEMLVVSESTIRTHTRRTLREARRAQEAGAA